MRRLVTEFQHHRGVFFSFFLHIHHSHVADMWAMASRNIIGVEVIFIIDVAPLRVGVGGETAGGGAGIPPQ